MDSGVHCRCGGAVSGRNYEAIGAGCDCERFRRRRRVGVDWRVSVGDDARPSAESAFSVFIGRSRFRVRTHGESTRGAEEEKSSLTVLAYSICELLSSYV